MFRVGMIGVGSIADVYLFNSRRMNNYRIIAAAGRDIERTAARAANWGVEATDVAALLQRSDIDAILNLTPPADHHAITRAALMAGKHVFSEKPLGATVAEALDLAATAKAQGVSLAVAPDSILGAGIQRARALIDAGAIGRPLMAEAAILYHGADSWHPNPSFFYRPGGGPAHDVGPYFIAAMASLFGPIAEVRATGFQGFPTRMMTAEGLEQGQTVNVEVLTSILALLSFRSGVQATLTTSWDVWKTSHPDLEIHGTEGSLSLPHPNFHGGPLRIASPGGDWREVPLGGNPTAIPNWPPAAPKHSNYRGIGLAEQLSAIAEKRPHRLSAPFGVHVVEAADAMVASAKTGQTVAVNLDFEPLEPFGAEAALSLLVASDGR